MTDFAALDQTRLRLALEAVLDVMVDAAEGGGWSPAESAVTLMQPGYGCDGLYVWPNVVVPVQGDPTQKCVRTPRVDVRWAMALCVGADATENAEWWRDRVDLLDQVWAVIGGIYQAAADGTMAKAVHAVAGTGKDCGVIQVGNAARFDSGDVLVWEGSLTILLPA